MTDVVASDSLHFPKCFDPLTSERQEVMKRAAHFLRTIEERNLSMKCVRKCYEKRSGEETDGKVANEE